MRIFVALDIDEAIRQRLAQFQNEMRALDPRQKWVGTDTFHVTLKFIGEQPPAKVEEIQRALVAIKAGRVQIDFRGAGFFPNARSPRVFWVGIQGDENLVKLASAVDAVTAAFGIEREAREYKPHLTLARAQLGGGRGASGSPHQRSSPPAASRLTDRASAGAFARVAQKLSAISPPEFGTMTASEFFLYESKLSPKGASYTKLARFGLE